MYRSPEPLETRIGTIIVAGNITFANILAGVVDTNANGFGNADDVIFANTTKALSSIGMIDGTAGGAEHFGITAREIKKIIINAIPVVLTAGAGNDDRPDQDHGRHHHPGGVELRPEEPSGCENAARPPPVRLDSPPPPRRERVPRGQRLSAAVFLRAGIGLTRARSIHRVTMRKGDAHLRHRWPACCERGAIVFAGAVATVRE